MRAVGSCRPARHCFHFLLALALFAPLIGCGAVEGALPSPDEAIDDDDSYPDDDDFTGPPDEDGDGWTADLDCDDADPTNHPGNVESCDGQDNDCDPATEAPGGEADGDGDGSLACADCHDADPAVFPGAVEVCDGVDTDCDSTTEAVGGEADADGDTFLGCEGDCDDGAPDVSPDAEEVVGNGVDDDCDGEVDCPVFVDATSVSLVEDGSESMPFHTIQAAVDAVDLAFCELVLVLPADYLENVVLDRAVTLESTEGAEVTVIDGDQNGPAIYIDEAPATVDGFTITGGSQLGGVFVSSVYSTEPAAVRRSSIIDNSSSQRGGGVQVMSYGGANIVLENCVIAGNTAAWQGGGVSLRERGGTEIVNNTIVGNTAGSGGGGLFFDNWIGISAPAFVEGNIVAFNSGGGIRSCYAYTAPALDYNLVYGNTGGDWIGSATPGPSSLSADPLFVDFTYDGDWSNDDLTLAPGSPATDAGNPLPLFDDVDGSRNDLGAWGGPLGDW